MTNASSLKWLSFCLALLTATLSAAQALGAEPSAAPGGAAPSGTLGLRPGLWNVELTYQSLDGRQVLDTQDLFARLLASVNPTDLALDRVNTALAQSPCANEGAFGTGPQSQLDKATVQRSQDMPECTLPFAMRMQADAAINESGANEGATSSYRICLTPAMAAVDAPVLDAQNSCHPEQVRHDGKRVSFSFSCNTTGTTLTGKGESHRTFLGHILTLTDFTATTDRNTHFAVHDRTEMKYLGADCGAAAKSAAP